MTPTESLVPTAGPAQPVAPRRAAPLAHATTPDPSAVAAALALARGTGLRIPVTPPAGKPRAIEAKIAAAGYDAEQMLRTLDTEMALRRASHRLGGDGKVQAFRVLSVALLFTLLIAALGAMSYVQTQFTGHGFRHHGAPASTSPAPGPSVPGVGPDHRSARPTR